MRNNTNPFVISGYISPDFFCDREKETSTMIEALSNQRNLTLYGRRKLGKTALIKHIFNKIDTNYITIWVDLLPAQSFPEMVNIMANNIYYSIKQNKSYVKKFMDELKNLRPVISYDDLSGMPQITIEAKNNNQTQKHFKELMNILKTFKKHIVIALDEFQQILKFPEKDTEAYLRTLMQNFPELTFIFSGSDQHVLSQMFTRYDKPFYQMSQILELKVIEKSSYSKFILHHFKNANKNIETIDIEYVLEWTHGITYYVQYIFNRLFSKNIKQIKKHDILSTLDEILNEFDGIYYSYRNILTRIQWNVLKAIAKEEKVQRIYSKSFLKKYNFYNPSSIKKSVESLIKDQLIYKSTAKGVPQYEIQDVFLEKWLARLPS